MQIEPAPAAFADTYAAGRAQVVWTTLVADLETPVSAFLKVAGRRRLSFLLESVEGGEQIARYLIDIAAHASSAMTMLETTVNGQPGLVAQIDGVTVTVFAFDITGDRIRHIWAIRNPDKLRPWTTA